MYAEPWTGFNKARISKFKRGFLVLFINDLLSFSEKFPADVIMKKMSFVFEQHFFDVEIPSMALKR